ncbi:MAG: hypothetical protein K0U93_24055 [Gammaproteobacteria bacterium]|nr:hypothetical protein [Gammaproteobacteria bacterium]
MTIKARFGIKLPDIPAVDPTRVDAITRDEILPAVESATLLLERAVTVKTPVGATGMARGSIQSAVNAKRGLVTSYRGRVMSAAPYIVPLEEGSRPHWAPIAPLKRWARIKLGDERIAYAVQRVIARRGTKGKHMFRDATLEEGARIERMLRQGVERWRRRLGGK